MNSANVELARAICAKWARGDFSSTDWAHPEIEYVRPDGPTPGHSTGVAAMARSWGETLSAWDNLRAEAEEYRALDDERVLVFIRNRGRGKASGLELGDMETRGANVFHFRDGKVTKLIIYFSRDLALAELNL
jgi:ketosteroid isomerase-like protein